MPLTNPQTKNSPEPVAPGRGCIPKNYVRDSTIISPRLRRLATALLLKPQTVRELCDIIPSNNSAEYIRQLRIDYGLKIPCEHVTFVTIDGNTSWHGKYHLTADDREKLASVFTVEAA